MKKVELNYKPIEPTNLNRNNIESQANYIREQLKISSSKSLFDVVTNLGGYVRFEDGLNLPSNGSIEVKSSKNFIISLSSLNGPLQNRFIIAHQLGHYFLHSNNGNKQIKSDREDIINKSNELIKADNEADWFAIELLVPKIEIEKLINDKNTMNYFAEYFYVSVNVIKSRLKSLGYE